MNKKPFKITYSKRFKLWTVWHRTTGSIYPIVVGAKTLQDAWKEAADNTLWGKAFRANPETTK